MADTFAEVSERAKVGDFALIWLPGEVAVSGTVLEIDSEKKSVTLATAVGGRTVELPEHVEEAQP